MRAFNRKRVPLSPSLALVLPLVLAAGVAGDAGSPALASTASTSAVIPVSNCNDGGPGSLRAAIAAAASGDTINLRSLECRRIVLAGAIEIPQDDLTLLGPTRALLVDGNRAGPVFVHAGNGTLRIRAMSIGYGLHQGVEPSGGCIESGGDLRLEYVRVHHCAVEADGGLEPTAYGGGLRAANAALYDSQVDSNSVSSGSESWGGGLMTGHLLLVRSRIINNVAGMYVGGASASKGLRMYHSEISDNRAASWGGVMVRGGDITIAHSTIAGNQAANSYGGADLDGITDGSQDDYNVLIMNSTISGNMAPSYSGLLLLGRNSSLFNSTIAFNRENEGAGQCTGALRLIGRLHMESTIVARNTCGSRRLDIAVISPSTEIFGSDNLVGTSTAPLPPDTISAEPRMSPLADNGGRTRTHALWAGSPAVDMGNNNAGLEYDQRGRGFPRVKGGRADIGAHER